MPYLQPIKTDDEKLIVVPFVMEHEQRMHKDGINQPTDEVKQRINQKDCKGIQGGCYFGFLQGADKLCAGITKYRGEEGFPKKFITDYKVPKATFVKTHKWKGAK
ncbi:hypothetical protein [Kiloniella antarctica]|uniref:Uncharacterized protein n=1 Tax=Kiloniella antarctica TaxID=1550907 RepID=A0ABW5BHV5_9PROT